ncbi:protein MARD1-like [Quillaja saponaria]|uniref:Protein MARD1-like n=1 Tax=Quillaja saponaria TaxID=32244 RepID=A0AAD7VEJ4_QUISA|nr:protein MARD1-like [Quillaja saponaria]
MLRNRSRAVTSKQALMADHSTQPSANQNYTKFIPSLFGSPKFRAFTTKCLSGNEALRSPTSILDTKPLSPFGHPFSFDRHQPMSPKISSEHKYSWDKLDSEGIGLALIDAIKDELVDGNSSKPSNKKVLFGTQLRVDIPPLPSFTFSSTGSPRSPADFGTKTQNSCKSPFESMKYPPEMVATGSSILASEMELSEDYTCVICHGPNPRTTHIFENRILESYYSLPKYPNSASENFLNFCYTCKKNLEQTKDIFIYRGEKAFCSRQCRYQEMLLDDAENSEFDSDAYMEIF